MWCTAEDIKAYLHATEAVSSTPQLDSYLGAFQLLLLFADELWGKWQDAFGVSHRNEDPFGAKQCVHITCSL